MTSLITKKSTTTAVNKEILVHGNMQWVNTDINLPSGSTLRISANGYIRNGEDSALYEPHGSTTGSQSSLNIVPDAPSCSLVGRIAGQEGFLVGSNFDQYIENGGQLDLSFNGNSNSFSKNEGLFAVTITVTTETEVYDTSDAPTAEYIQTILNKYRSKNCVDSSGGTKETPVKLKANFIFCDFPDAQGKVSDITELYQDLIGTSDDMKLVDFIKKESADTVELTLSHRNDWIRLPKTTAEYIGNSSELLKDLDTEIDFPDDANAIFLAFPEMKVSPLQSDDIASASGALIDTEGRRYTLGTSHCLNGQIVDKPESGIGGQSLSVLYLDAKIYHETVGTDKTPHAPYVTVHEFMHALGLPDLYYGKLNRSYGWSIMSAAGAARHILEIEKLLMGWTKLDDYIFPVKGSVTETLSVSELGQKRGIVVLPEANSGRFDLYVFEPAKPIGVGKANFNKFKNEHPNGIGLLSLIVLPSSNGRIVPFVYARPDDIIAARKLYGGASKAAYPKGSCMETLGVTLNVNDVTPSSVNCTVSVNKNFKPPKFSRRLREGERLEDRNFALAMSTIGDIWLGNHKAADSSEVVCEENGTLVNADYGFTLFVDNKGHVHLAKSVDENPKANDILKTWKPNQVLMNSLKERGLAETTGIKEAIAPACFVMKVDRAHNNVSVQLQEADGNLKHIYTVFKKV